jgi:hypothetical protein
MQSFGMPVISCPQRSWISVFFIHCVLYPTSYTEELEIIIICYKSVGVIILREMKYISGLICQISQAMTDRSDWDVINHCISISDGVEFNDYVTLGGTTAVYEARS